MKDTWVWRAGFVGTALVAALLAWQLDPVLGVRARSGFGALCFLAVAFAASEAPRAIQPRTVLWGIALQIGLALLVFRSTTGRRAFEIAGAGIGQFVSFAQEGARFVFGVLADPAAMSAAFPERGFVFAFVALPTIVFVSSFFSVLYHLGVLQLVVRAFAAGMRLAMHTSGPETLSVTANVFMGQTEAPLIVKPYIAGMTRSELLALMTGGMATVSGAMMAVYMNLGADPVALLTTSVMAAPCSLYLSKILIPETGTPATEPAQDEQHATGTVIEAAAAGASDGMTLAINVAAMLIAFIATVALVNAVLGAIHPSLSLESVFGAVFAPVAYLMGVDTRDITDVGTLLGKKLVLNELVAFLDLRPLVEAGMTERSRTLATYALTGFANVSSIGIQLGGIGALAPSRRRDLAALGPRALFAGFLATLVNAAVAGLLLT